MVLMIIGVLMFDWDLYIPIVRYWNIEWRFGTRNYRGLTERMKDAPLHIEWSQGFGYDFEDLVLTWY